MSSVSVLEEAVTFSPNMPVNVNKLLQEAVVASREDKQQAEHLFMQAYQLDKQCLQTYFALYKFYFYQAKLDDAECYVRKGLLEASQQGGFPADYQQLANDAGQWNMYADEVSLFYLYTLKALAFVKLRQQQNAEANEILHILHTLDPEDRSGFSVIVQLSKALMEEEA